jgi:hypothetical protein
MTVFATRSGRTMTTAIAAGCAILIASSALAAPIVNIGISVAGGTGGPQVIPGINQNTVPSATPGIFEGFGNQNDPTVNNEWSINWGVTADDDPSPFGQIGTRLGANFTIVNNRTDGALFSDNHLQFSILVNLNLLAGFAQNVMYAANGGPTITVPAGQAFEGQLTTVGNNPMTNFLLDNTSQASLFAAGSILAASSNPGGGSSTNSWSGNVPLTPYTPPPSSMSILMNFDLSPGETVTFNYNYFVIPTPGAIALLGIAGVVGTRRRRN